MGSHSGHLPCRSSETRGRCTDHPGSTVALTSAYQLCASGHQAQTSTLRCLPSAPPCSHDMARVYHNSSQPPLQVYCLSRHDPRQVDFGRTTCAASSTMGITSKVQCPLPSVIGVLHHAPAISITAVPAGTSRRLASALRGPDRRCLTARSAPLSSRQYTRVLAPAHMQHGTCPAGRSSTLITATVHLFEIRVSLHGLTALQKPEPDQLHGLLLGTNPQQP